MTTDCPPPARYIYIHIQIVIITQIKDCLNDKARKRNQVSILLLKEITMLESKLAQLHSSVEKWKLKPQRDTTTHPPECLK